MVQYANDIAYADVLTTHMNTLSDTVTSTASADQSPDRGLADFSLIVPSMSAPAAGAVVEVHICPRAGDGTSFADVGTGTLVGVMPVTSGAGTKVLVLPRIPLPNDTFQWRVTNRTGVTWPTSGSVARAKYYDVASG